MLVIKTNEEKMGVQWDSPSAFKTSRKHMIQLGGKYYTTFSLNLVHPWTYLNETHSKVNTGKHLPYALSIPNGLKQGNALSSLLLNFTLEYTIMKVQENKQRLELNATHQLPVYAGDVNLLGKNINIIKRNTDALLHASEEVGLEANTEKTKYYMFVPHHQTTGNNPYLRVANKSFENMEQQ
jgi:hypothetical protein